MFVIFGALIGGIIGGFVAKKRGGNRLDIAQYIGIYAIAFSLAGLILTIVVHRLAV